MLKKYSLRKLLSRIRTSDEKELNEIISQIIRTYSCRYPDQEIMFLSLPKNDPDERKRTLDAMYNFMSQQP